MPDSTDTRRSRRALIAGVVAAGATLPLIAAKGAAGGTKFVVELGGVVLPDAVAARLEVDIRRAVLTAVAQGAPHRKFRSGPLPPGVRGIVLVPMPAPGGL